MRSARSKTVDRVPGAASCCAQASPAGPEPTTATRLAGASRGGTCGTTQPSSKAWSMICFSICLMVTGSSLMLSTQASSHGAGQMRPVNSGKLLVECRRSIASFQRPRYTRSFQSGMMFPSGQPLWQKGMPQSMQRAPCCCSLSSGSLPSSSRQSFRRSATGRRARQLALDLEKSGDLAHATCLSDRDSDARELRGFGVEVLLREHLAVLDRHHLRRSGAPLSFQPDRMRQATALCV